MAEIKLEKRYPDSRAEDITDAYMRGVEAGRALSEREIMKLREGVNGHVHEQLIRCRDCRFCGTLVFQADVRHECRLSPYARHFTEPDGYCHKGKPRGGDG